MSKSTEFYGAEPATIGYAEWPYMTTEHRAGTVVHFAPDYYPDVTASPDGRLHWGTSVTEPVPLNTAVHVRVDPRAGVVSWSLA